jgi:hypothetical protein
VFGVFDADGRGSIDAGELGHLLAELCVPVKKLAQLMRELDSDGSGEIDFEEFASWYERRSRGGLRALVGSAGLLTQKINNSLVGAQQMAEARRIIVACAVHDFEQQMRLVFRQSRPAMDLARLSAAAAESDAMDHNREVRQQFAAPFDSRLRPACAPLAPRLRPACVRLRARCHSRRRQRRRRCSRCSAAALPLLPLLCCCSRCSAAALPLLSRCSAAAPTALLPLPPHLRPACAQALAPGFTHTHTHTLAHSRLRHAHI